jgi:hypothetical protein
MRTSFSAHDKGKDVMRIPQEGGMMVGGPHDGRIMAWNSPRMSTYDSTGKRTGQYLWDEDHWVWESDDGDDQALYEM